MILIPLLIVGGTRAFISQGVVSLPSCSSCSRATIAMKSNLRRGMRQERYPSWIDIETMLLLFFWYFLLALYMMFGRIGACSRRWKINLRIRKKKGFQTNLICCATWPKNSSFTISWIRNKIPRCHCCRMAFTRALFSLAIIFFEIANNNSVWQIFRPISRNISIYYLPRQWQNAVSFEISVILLGLPALDLSWSSFSSLFSTAKVAIAQKLALPPIGKASSILTFT